MTPKKKSDSSETVTPILKRLVKRIEDATVDIHTIKIDIKETKVRLGDVEENTKLLRGDIAGMKSDIAELKTDGEKISADIGEIKTEMKRMGTEVHDLTIIAEAVVTKMVTQEELVAVSDRVTSLERAAKAS